METQFCLWLDGFKIHDIRSLREHFDLSALIGYFIGGGLERWLADIGENAVLERVRRIDREKNIAEQLAYAFGMRLENAEELAALEKEIKLRHSKAALSSGSPSSGPSLYGSLFRSSFFGGSYNFGSGIIGSGIVGSFKKGSFRGIHRWEWEWEYRFGSFKRGSFRIGSFKRGSFRRGSFKKGSFRFGSLGSGIFASGLYTEFIGGSFRYFIGDAEITLSEYKKTMKNLSSCPLNMYGYGINLI